MDYLNIKLKGIDENGEEKEYKLADFKGKNIIVYFYPQDDTPICTIEAQEFRDAMETLKEHAIIIGISHNNINDHIDFHKKHNLNFILISDTENKLKKSFEGNDKYITNIHRATFILDKNGKIIKFWNKVDVDGHIQEILNFFK